MRFCRRYGVALRGKTHAAQTDPKQVAPAITKFNLKLLRVRRRGVYQTKDIANMDQTPLLFVLDDGKTYADKGSSEIWCVSGSSGLDKRQCSVQLTIFADGVPRVRSLLYFVEKAWKLLAKSKKLWTGECRLHFNQSLVRRINDKKMDIGTMEKHLYKPPNNWLNCKNFSC